MLYYVLSTLSNQSLKLKEVLSEMLSPHDSPASQVLPISRMRKPRLSEVMTCLRPDNEGRQDSPRSHSEPLAPPTLPLCLRQKLDRGKGEAVPV